MGDSIVWTIGLWGMWVGLAGWSGVRCRIWGVFVEDNGIGSRRIIGIDIIRDNGIG